MNTLRKKNAELYIEIYEKRMLLEDNAIEMHKVKKDHEWNRVYSIWLAEPVVRELDSICIIFSFTSYVHNKELWHTEEKIPSIYIYTVEWSLRSFCCNLNSLLLKDQSAIYFHIGDVGNLGPIFLFLFWAPLN